MQKIEEHYSLLTFFVQGSIIDERFLDLDNKKIKFILYVYTHIYIFIYNKVNIVSIKYKYIEKIR